MFNFFKKASIMELEEAAVERAISEVVRQRTHHAFSGHPNVREFEEQLSKLLGGVPALGVNSGTDALVLALKVLGIGPGDEVITPAFGFVSTASCIPWVGATPIFADIRPNDFSLDPAQVARRITKKTKVIIVAHLCGQPATGIEEIARIARERSIYVIEDVAQSFGSRIKINGEWRPAGSIGDIGCFSFSSTKPLAAPGNGGALLIKNPAFFEEAERMRFYGANKNRHYYEYPTVGMNCKMHDMQAAALLAKLKFLRHWSDYRKDIAALYEEQLRDIQEVILPAEEPDTSRTWYLYVVRADGAKRDHLFTAIASASSPYYPLHPTRNYSVPVPYFDIFRKLGYKFGDFPVADTISRELISLPITNYVTMSDVKRMCEAIKNFFSTASSKDNDR